ncbi:MAG TPA: sulfurtransferase [Burkholderiales bacterium]|nr:sulfurtransferase [Burkholderiales bacterium]
MILTALVSTEILEPHLADPDWIVFDCRHDLAAPERGRSEYAMSHIPGARFLHLDEDLSAPKTGRNGRHPLPGPQVLMEKLGRAGVDARKQVVAYDAQGGMVASRLWWLLRWLGHLPVAVLDGGWDRWIKEGRPQTAEIPRPAPARFNGKPKRIVVSAESVRSQLDDGTTLLLDARAPDRYRGQNETIDPVAGRIPGARNRHYRDNLDAGGRFKAPEALRREFRAVLGAAKPEDIVSYCGSGVSACHNLLAMEVAGLHGARLYPGSWSEWSADPSRPIAAGDPEAISGEPRPGER